MNKYEETFRKFSPVGSDREVTEEVNNIIEVHAEKNFNAEVLKLIHGCIDLTSLSPLDTKESLWKLVESVNAFDGTCPDVPNVAAICTYPIFTGTVKQTLTAQNVKIAATTGGFPTGQTFIEVKIAETALAVAEGAEEIDTVLNPGLFMEESYEELAADIHEIKESCRHQAALKIILETGALKTSENIQRASVFAIFAGADFIKTSTGKEFAGATPEAVYTMCQVIREYYSLTNRKIGIKVAGGIRKAEDAVMYYTIIRNILGKEWLNKDFFRIGASNLAGDILKKIKE